MTAQSQPDTDRMQSASDLLEELEKLKSEHAQHVEDTAERIVELESAAEDDDEEIDELKAKVSELEEKVLHEDQLQRLAKVRSTLYAGKTDEGRDMLERVLDELDSCWRLYQ